MNLESVVYGLNPWISVSNSVGSSMSTSRPFALHTTINTAISILKPLHVQLPLSTLQVQSLTHSLFIFTFLFYFILFCCCLILLFSVASAAESLSFCISLSLSMDFPPISMLVLALNNAVHVKHVASNWFWTEAFWIWSL